MPRNDDADDADKASLIVPPLPDLKDDLYVLSESDDRVSGNFADDDGEAL
jgi:hypothetical protein